MSNSSGAISPSAQQQLTYAQPASARAKQHNVANDRSTCSRGEDPLVGWEHAAARGEGPRRGACADSDRRRGVSCARCVCACICVHASHCMRACTWVRARGFVRSGGDLRRPWRQPCAHAMRRHTRRSTPAQPASAAAQRLPRAQQKANSQTVGSQPPTAAAIHCLFDATPPGTSAFSTAYAQRTATESDAPALVDRRGREEVAAKRSPHRRCDMPLTGGVCSVHRSAERVIQQATVSVSTWPEPAGAERHQRLLCRNANRCLPGLSQRAYPA
jgi:hypothetical protein